MPVQFVNAGIEEFRAARRTERVRSPEVRQLIEAIGDLKPGLAKAVVVERGESAKMLRSRISYAARTAGAKVRIVDDGERLMFSLRGGGRSGASVGKQNAAARKAAVRQHALAIGRRRKEIAAEDVVESLDSATLDGVRRPGTMVGAVLRSMDEFERVGHNRFRFKG